MKGEIIGFNGNFPLVSLPDGTVREADYLLGDVWKVGDIVFLQDVSSLPEDPDHLLITSRW